MSDATIQQLKQFGELKAQGILTDEEYRGAEAQASGGVVMNELTSLGPVQMLVLGFDRTQFDGTILPELKRLTDAAGSRA